jgi:hypothetical protein
MSKAVAKLRKIERQSFRDWWKSARELAELYNAAITADARDRDERCSMATFAAVRTQQQWDRWQTLNGSLEELEDERDRATRRPPIEPLKATG